MYVPGLRRAFFSIFVGKCARFSFREPERSGISGAPGAAPPSPDVDEHRKRIAVAARIDPPRVGGRRTAASGIEQVSAGEHVASDDGEGRVRQNAVAHHPASAAADRAPSGARCPCRGVAQSVAGGFERCGASQDEQLRSGPFGAQVADDPFAHACVGAQDQSHGVAPHRPLDVEVMASRLGVVGIEEVAVVEQGEIQAVERVERAVQVGVIAPAGGGQVAHDPFVLHAPERHDGQGHRVDDGRRIADLAGIAFGRPAQASPGRVLLVVVEKRRKGVVEPVHVVKGDADRPFGGRAAGRGSLHAAGSLRRSAGRGFPDGDGSSVCPG